MKPSILVWISGLAFSSGLALGCAAGVPSRLHTFGKASGHGEIRFEVENRTDAIVNNLYVAPSKKVNEAGEAAFRTSAPEQSALWGNDLLPGSGLEPRGKVNVAIESPGPYDVRARDRDGREQHISGLRLEAGGRYVLELGEGSWRTPK